MGDGGDRHRTGQLRELIYTSRATTRFENEQLVDLLDRARSNNETSGITGILIHSDGAFLQILEGPADSIRSLFAALRIDGRHSDIRVISDRPIGRRTFDDWSMAFRDAPLDRLAAYDPHLGGGGGFAHLESGLARRLAIEFLALHP